MQLSTGDIVKGRPVRRGKTGRPRKGVVLGRSLADASVLLVWWYGEGNASQDTTTMAYETELQPLGDIFELSAGYARDLAKACRSFDRARVLAGYLDRHAVRLGTCGH